MSLYIVSVVPDERCKQFRYTEINDYRKCMESVGIDDDPEFWGFEFYQKACLPHGAYLKESISYILSKVGGLGCELDEIIISEPSSFPMQLVFEEVDNWIKTKARGCEVRTVSGYNCVNLIYALHSSRSRSGSNSSKLLLSIEALQDEKKRIGKYAIFSDYAVGVLLSESKPASGYRVLNSEIEVDDDISLNHDSVALATTDSDCLGRLLQIENMNVTDIEKVCYINVFDPIRNMKLRSLGLKADQIHRPGSPNLGHCFGADPFLQLNECRSVTGKILLLSSGPGLSGGVIVQSINNKKGFVCE
jgi:hypothetical protein